MMAMIGGMVFAGAFAVSVAVIAFSVAPQWRRILRLASGHVEPAFQPLQTLARAERRIAVRRWASSSLPARLRRSRAAA